MVIVNYATCFVLTGLYYPSKGKFKVLVIVMEKMQLSLRGFMEKHGHLPLNNAMTILHDVCLGLQYLHSRTPPIVHRDLTPNNILLCNHLRAKITDLGVARTLKAADTKAMTRAPGTPGFMPPECLVDNPFYGLPLDIFSFGGVILYITTQEWPNSSPQMTINNALTSDHELQRHQQYLKKMTGAFESLKPLVVSCLDNNPKNRPTVTEVLTGIQEIMKSQDDDDYCHVFVEEEDDSTESPNQLEKSPPNQYERKDQQHPLPSQQGQEQRGIAPEEQLVPLDYRAQKQQNQCHQQEKQEQPEEQKLEEHEQMLQMPQLVII